MSKLIFFGANNMSLQLAAFAREQGIHCVIMCNAAQAEKFADIVGIQLVIVEKTADLPIETHFDKTAESLAISIGAPWFFDRDFIENRMGGALLNLHGTHLPRSRGGTLFSWQILSGQRTGMCLLHQMEEALDAGAVVDYQEFIYPAQCRKPLDFIRFYEEKNIQFLQAFLLKWLKDKALKPVASQPEYLSTYWPRLRADVNGWLDWNWPALELERFVCAFDEPYGAARCRWRGHEILLRDAWAQSCDGHTHPFQWGIVTRNNGEWLNVAANGGELLICSVQDTEGRSLLHEIRPGDRLSSTAEDLEKAARRVVKTAQGLDIQPDK